MSAVFSTCAGRMVRSSRTPATSRRRSIFNHVHVFHEDPACAQLWYATHLGIGTAAQGRGEPHHGRQLQASVRRGRRGRPSTRSAWCATRRAAVPVSDMASILIRPRHGPYVSPRGQIVDHFALSVPDLDGHRRPAEERGREGHRRDSPLGHDARGDDRRTRSRRDRARLAVTADLLDPSDP